MQVLTADQATALIHDGDTIVIGGSGSGHAIPEALIEAVERRFLATAAPRSITSLHPVGLGDRSHRGISHFAHPGLLKRVVCGTVVDAPAVADMANRNEIEAYTLPQGALSQLMREIAAGRPGLLTHVGLHTFVDPRISGGKQSTRCTDDLVELVELKGREWLFYKPFDINVAFLRGTTADQDGNISMEDEAVFGEMLSMAQATRRCGGIVIVQVKRLAQRGTLPGKTVKIPGMLVDVVVVEPDQHQTYQTRHDPAFAGQLRIPLGSFPTLPLDERKIVARRCAMELEADAICNVGSGICTGIGIVAAEENILEHIVLTNEQGLIGGAPANGLDAGASRNYWAMIDQPYQFDFYDGGGLDLAFLSAVEVDAQGSVNISRFANRVIGIGGFVNISQNARKMVFGGTFTAGGLKIATGDGQLAIVTEGKHRKFVEKLEQVSYSGPYGRERGQTTLFVTERAVFRSSSDGLELIEIAPGIDLERDILSQMGFRPLISPALRTMDERIFRAEPMGIAKKLAGKTRAPHPRLAASNGAAA
ncbi:acyl CoA:acetate/3-ketoacid CoA transferase [Burkholderia gladioli]|uniref:acyl CoA:acetate/3-ketoacid CoA transferase n=1 Tax=Burkholderia gladioli TaxID=28095 RepID=UPI0022CFEA5D|nr:CoA-transferase [Burkholderia gladioli]MDA0569472.1 3-oxoacid CoA-transferase [Burkholderia gladioli]MDA0598036.1 3-oxoacid CoA-transferase [Burkholderia gladioli]